MVRVPSGPAQVSRQHGVGELPPWFSLGGRRANPPCLGAAGNSPCCVWACMWPQVRGEGRPAGRGAAGSTSPASPTYTLLLGGPCSEWPPSPLPPCSSLSAGPHTAGGTVWLPFSGESSHRGPLRDAAGRHSPQPGCCWPHDQESLRSSGFDSGLGCAWRHKTQVLRPLWLSALGWPHAGLSTCHSARVSPRWGRVALEPLSLLPQASGCCLPFPRAGAFPCEHQVGPPCFSGSPLPTGHPEPVLCGPVPLLSQTGAAPVLWLMASL